RYETSFGMTPPDECLGADDTTTAAKDVEDGLIVHLELSARERSPHRPVGACVPQRAEAQRLRLVHEQGHHLTDADEGHRAPTPVAEYLRGAGAHLERKQRPRHQPG